MPGHHVAHAYSAYGTSPFPQSAVLVIDEQGHHVDGQFEKCAWFEGTTGPLRVMSRFLGGGDELSLGMFYNAFAFLTGLSEAAMPAAGKLMGLAAFGNTHPEWPALIDLDAETGDAHVSLQRLDEFFTLAGVPHRPGMSDRPVRDMEDLAKYAPVRWTSELAADLARKAEDELERAVLHIASALRRRSSARHPRIRGRRRPQLHDQPPVARSGLGRRVRASGGDRRWQRAGIGAVWLDRGVGPSSPAGARLQSVHGTPGTDENRSARPSRRLVSTPTPSTCRLPRRVRNGSPAATSCAGSRARASGGRARWALAASSPARSSPACGTASTGRSSTANRSGPSGSAEHSKAWRSWSTPPPRRPRSPRTCWPSDQ